MSDGDCNDLALARQGVGQALALMVDGRFFVGFNKARRVQTAWCLAGARLFQNTRTEKGERDALQARVLKATFHRRPLPVLRWVPVGVVPSVVVVGDFW